MKQPLILTAEQRDACAHAHISRDAMALRAGLDDDERVFAHAIGLVRRAETYLAVVHAHTHVLTRLREPRRSNNKRGQMVVVKRPELHSEAITLAVQGHDLLLALIKASHGPHEAALVLADVAFGVDLNPEAAPASE